jgi:uncharacterized membrane protein
MANRQRAADAIALAFLGSALIHFAKPSTYLPIMPRWIPKPTAVIYVSGLAEIVAGFGMLTRRSWGRTAGVVTLLAVLPANVQHVLDAGTGRNEGIFDKKAFAWGRLPLQIPMIWAAAQAKTSRNAGIDEH